VDAAEFRDRFAPAVTRMARHVTLYASANDRALVASTKVHGYTRAGLSGDSMTVVPGIETVDVSPIDTSLIGHSYYGDNPLMIRDMQALVELSSPAAKRPWLEQIARSPSLAYWVFRQGLHGSVLDVGSGIALPDLHR
jgi:esterase/lipase superfamily enzyme